MFGAGQSPGEGLGNGRAAAIRYAREGARALAVNRSMGSTGETASIIESEGFECVAFAADVRRKSDIAAAIQDALSRWGTADVLHNNVGRSLDCGDTDILSITEEAFDTIQRI